MKKVTFIIATVALIATSTFNAQAIVSENGIVSLTGMEEIKDEPSCTVTATVSLGYDSTYGSVTCTTTADNCEEANKMLKDCIVEAKKNLENL